MNWFGIFMSLMGLVDKVILNVLFVINVNFRIGNVCGLV